MSRRVFALYGRGGSLPWSMVHGTKQREAAPQIAKAFCVCLFIFFHSILYSKARHVRGGFAQRWESACARPEPYHPADPPSFKFAPQSSSGSREPQCPKHGPKYPSTPTGPQVVKVGRAEATPARVGSFPFPAGCPPGPGRFWVA